MDLKSQPAFAGVSTVRESRRAGKRPAPAEKYIRTIGSPAAKAGKFPAFLPGLLGVPQEGRADDARVVAQGCHAQTGLVAAEFAVMLMIDMSLKRNQ
jgi:hypothetical protein